MNFTSHGTNMLGVNHNTSVPDSLRAVQLMDFTNQLRRLAPVAPNFPTPLHPQHPPRLLPLDPCQLLLSRSDPRLAFLPEEPKPSHSYIGLIAMGILSSKEKKLVLSDIYQWILDNYPYFHTRGQGWRNSIRHNLSLNECFEKLERAPNGKGHFWGIHAAVVKDFERGDFRRRRAQRKVRRSKGLAVTDEDDDDDSPPPPCSGDVIAWRQRMLEQQQQQPDSSSSSRTEANTDDWKEDGATNRKSETSAEPITRQDSVEEGNSIAKHSTLFSHYPHPHPHLSRNLWKFFPFHPLRLFPVHPHLTSQTNTSDDVTRPAPVSTAPKRRAFDVESLLAPEAKRRAPDDAETDANGEALHENCESKPEKVDTLTTETRSIEKEREETFDLSESDSENIDVDGFAGEIDENNL